jgi:intein-encoded DNA endonuclease-like protein
MLLTELIEAIDKMEVLETKEKFIELRAKGWSFDKIAKELGKAKQTLIDWSKELEDEIANLKALELEALYESYYLLRENRLQTFGAMLTKIKEEVESRDLSDVPTDKLLELLLKYNSQVKEEIIEPTYKSSKEITEERQDKELLAELTSLQIDPVRRLKIG